MGSEKKVPERYNYVLLDRMVEDKYGQYVRYINYAILEAELAAAEKNKCRPECDYREKVTELQAENRRLRGALEKIEFHEAERFKISIGYDDYVMRITTKALKDTK